MDFKTFWLSMPIPERRLFSARVGASFSTLNQYSSVGRPVSPEIHLAIERESGGVVTIPASIADGLARAGYVKARPELAQESA